MGQEHISVDGCSRASAVMAARRRRQAALVVERRMEMRRWGNLSERFDRMGWGLLCWKSGSE